jgi:hypothetical protein
MSLMPSQAETEVHEKRVNKQGREPKEVYMIKLGTQLSRNAISRLIKEHEVREQKKMGLFFLTVDCNRRMYVCMYVCLHTLDICIEVAVLLFYPATTKKELNLKP